jgi:hypothetical protein
VAITPRPIQWEQYRLGNGYTGSIAGYPLMTVHWDKGAWRIATTLPGLKSRQVAPYQSVEDAQAAAQRLLGRWLDRLMEEGAVDQA